MVCELVGTAPIHKASFEAEAIRLLA